MANEEKKYTAEFKKKIARQALNQSRNNLDTLSEQYDVPVSAIQLWTSQLENAIDKMDDVFEAGEVDTSVTESSTVDLEITNSKVADSIEHGVMFDQLNYKRLVFWSVFGIVLVVIFVQALFEMFEYNEQLIQNRVSAESEYYQVNELKKEARQQLDSFGVVSLENGIYRMPIDSAIDEMVDDTE